MYDNIRRGVLLNSFTPPGCLCFLVAWVPSQVLWVEAVAPYGDTGRIGQTLAKPAVARRALRGMAGQLRLCMINPDLKMKSRWTGGVGKKADRLEGEKPKPIPEYSFGFDMF